jgi:hypothetical protein
METVKPIVRAVQPDLSKVALQQRPEVSINKQLRPQQNYVAAGGRDRDPHYDETPPTNTQPSFPSFSTARTSIPDRLDRTSVLTNQQLDNMHSMSPQYSSSQQPYVNRVNEIPPNMYSQPPSGPLRMSNQNITDPSYNEPKMNANFRNPYGVDPHSQMDQGNQGMERGRDTVRRSQMGPQMRTNSSNPQSSGNNSYTFQQAMSDHFDHYKRPPSRDTSVDRYGARNRSRTRGATPEVQMGPGPINQAPQSRAHSRARTPLMDNPAAMRTASNVAIDAILAMENANVVPNLRGQTPSRLSGSGRGESPGIAMFSDTGSASGMDLEELRFRGGLGQEIMPTPYTPKRTESLFLKPALLPKAAGPSPMVFYPFVLINYKQTLELYKCSLLAKSFWIWRRR